MQNFCIQTQSGKFQTTGYTVTYHLESKYNDYLIDITEYYPIYNSENKNHQYTYVISVYKKLPEDLKYNKYTLWYENGDIFTYENLCKVINWDIAPIQKPDPIKYGKDYKAPNNSFSFFSNEKCSNAPHILAEAMEKIIEQDIKRISIIEINTHIKR